MSESTRVISGIEAMRGVGQQRALGFWADAWQRVLRRPSAVLALAWIGLVAAGAVLAMLDKFDQSIIYMGTEEYTRWARETFNAEKATIERLGMAMKG